MKEEKKLEKVHVDQARSRDYLVTTKLYFWEECIPPAERMKSVVTDETRSFPTLMIVLWTYIAERGLWDMG